MGIVLPAHADSPPPPTIIRADNIGVTLRWEFPPVAIAAQLVDNQPFSVVTMDAFPADGTPGAPNLPHAGTLVGLPPTGGATLRIIELETETITLPALPLPAPSFSAVGNPPTAREMIAPNPAVFARNAFFPAETAQLSAPIQIRRQRLARLTVNPVRVNPVSRRAIIVRAITVQVLFDGPVPASRTSAVPSTDPIARTLTVLLANPQAARWQLPRPPLPRVAASAAISEAKIVVTAAGLYALTRADLQAAGLPVDTLDPRKLQLTHGYPRQSVAIQVDGETDGHFDPGDRILFYATSTFSRYTDEDVYFLQVNDTSGTRMETRAGDPTGLPAGAIWFTATAEENHEYEPQYPTRNGDPWYWADIRRGERADLGLTISRPQNDGSATLWVWVQGTTNPVQTPNHRVRVLVNGQQVTEEIWTGDTARVITAVVPSSYFVDGVNLVGIELPGLDGVTVEEVLLDAISLRYPARPADVTPLMFQGDAERRAYTLTGWQNTTPIVLDVTQPLAPAIVTNFSLAGNDALTIGDGDATPARYFITPDNAVDTPKTIQPAKTLADPPGGADYIIITHPDFAAAIAPLAAHRAAQGLRVVTVDVEAIYDTFGDGRMSAEAIKSFLQHAFSTWTPPAPTVVLLVGDGNYDFKDYLGWHNPTFVPPYLANVDPWLGETAADNQFVTLTGSDNFPDMLIGRLPVNTPAEAETVVDKIIHYETNPFPGGWNARQLFVVDDFDPNVGDFAAAADKAHAMLSAPLEGERFYYDPHAAGEGRYADATTLRDAFRTEFNRGAGVVSFTGHASWHQWAAEALFRWNKDAALNDVSQLTNGYQLPLVLEMTCFTSFFQHPEYPTLDESLLRHSGGGAIAVWGATGLGVATGHSQLQAGFYNAIITDGERNLGAAVLAGKTQLFANGFNQDLLDTFTLLGDPALTLDFDIVPFTHSVYLPLITR